MKRAGGKEGVLVGPSSRTEITDGTLKSRRSVVTSPRGRSTAVTLVTGCSGTTQPRVSPPGHHVIDRH